MGFSSESKIQIKRKCGPLLAKWRKVRYNASNDESKGADTVTFAQCFAEQPYLLMEGALGERLKREYGLRFDEHVAMAQLMRAAEGRVALRALWLEYAQTAAQYGLPFMATTPTRRANRERVTRVHCGEALIRENVYFLRSVQQEVPIPMYVGGLMGCKGDAYTAEGALSNAAAAEFHAWQAEQFRAAGADFLFAGIMPNSSEAVGMATAMASTELPYIISFTIRRDGCLIDGTPIAEAIARIDNTVTRKPLCYMTNCVHPAIAAEALAQPINQTETVKTRFCGIQVNTSPLPYDQLDGATDLQCAEPNELAETVMRLHAQHPLKIFGGCCGTDQRHMAAIAARLTNL